MSLGIAIHNHRGEASTPTDPAPSETATGYDNSPSQSVAALRGVLLALATVAAARRSEALVRVLILGAGFGGLLLLMMVAGGDALLVLRQVRASDAQVRDVYVRRSRALDQVRAGIYQSAIVMRDFLLASDPDIAAEQVASWTGIRELDKLFHIDIGGMLIGAIDSRLAAR